MKANEIKRIRRESSPDNYTISRNYYFKDCESCRRGLCIQRVEEYANIDRKVIVHDYQNDLN